MCNTMDGLFDISNNKFYPQPNETIKSLKYCKLTRPSNGNEEEWMEKPRTAMVENKYKEIDR